MHKHIKIKTVKDLKRAISRIPDSVLVTMTSNYECILNVFLRIGVVDKWGNFYDKLNKSEKPSEKSKPAIEFDFV